MTHPFGRLPATVFFKASCFCLVCQLNSFAKRLFVNRRPIVQTLMSGIQMVGLTSNQMALKTRPFG